jgi:hypothetical protein
MAYIEGFIYYIAVVVFMFIVLFGGIVLIYMTLGQFKIFFAKEEVTLEIEKAFLYKLIKNRFFKWAILAYFSAFTFFYINQAIKYFGGDRAYPQAKSYKIVADVVTFHFNFFIASRNLYYRPIGVKLIEPYEELQNYLMKKGFEYIPKNDAERAIWKYEYHYANYFRARTAPIDFDVLTPTNLHYILEIGGFPTVYKPKAREMLQEVEMLMNDLKNNPIKDARYDKVERYTSAINLTVWWNQFHFLKYTFGAMSPGEEVSQEYMNMINSWVEDLEYLSYTQSLLDWLDKVKIEADHSSELQNELKKHNLIYPDLLGLRIALMDDLVFVDLLHNGSSCKNESLKRYLKYKNDFLEYVNTYPAYKKLNWKERYVTDNLADSHLSDYLLFTFCGIKKETLEFKGSIDLNFDLNKTSYDERIKNIIKGFENE